MTRLAIAAIAAGLALAACTADGTDLAGRYDSCVSSMQLFGTPAAEAKARCR